MLGAPVDAVEPLHARPRRASSSALVEEVRPHPNADRLRVCLVNDGSAERRTWCAARPTSPPASKYPFARVGTSVPRGKGGAPMKIETRQAPRRALRGHALLRPRARARRRSTTASCELDTDAAPGTPLLEARAARRRPPRGRRHPQPPRPPRPQGHRARAGGVATSVPFRLPPIPGAASARRPAVAPRRPTTGARRRRRASRSRTPTACPALPRAR